MLQQLYDWIWSPVLVGFCLFSGLYFSLRTGFVQIRLLRPMLQMLFQRNSSDQGISPFQAFCTSLAGRVGTGNIAGTATAIFYGGPGALFWMWLSAFLGAATAFMESTLAQIYKVELDGQYRGGPAYYMMKGLGSPAYGTLFALAALLCGGLLLPGVQANAIAAAFEHALGAPPALTGLICAVLLALVIFGGVKRIARVSQVVVPLMALVYLGMAVLIILLNLERLGAVLALVLRSAFARDALFGALFGQAVAWGVKRGIYSNEAGQGTAPHAAAAAEVSHPVKQGLVQSFSVYIDTLFVCTATALMILLTDSFNVLGLAGPDGGEGLAEGALYLYAGGSVRDLAQTGAVGVQYAQAAVSTVLPQGGSLFVAICLGFFAFTSLIAFSYEAETNITFLFRHQDSAWRERCLTLLRLALVLVTFLTSRNSATMAWLLGDVGVGVTVWINMLALWALQRQPLLLLRDFEQQYRQGRDPIFDPRALKIKNADLWLEISRRKR